MYNYKPSKHLKRILIKLSKKDKRLFQQLLNKIDEIINCKDIEHYKNLRHDLKEYKRAHIGHFVLIFRLDKKTNCIYFTDFDHHDKIYKKKFYPED